MPLVGLSVRARSSQRAWSAGSTQIWSGPSSPSVSKSAARTTPERPPRVGGSPWRPEQPKISAPSTWADRRERRIEESSSLVVDVSDLRHARLTSDKGDPGGAARSAGRQRKEVLERLRPVPDELSASSRRNASGIRS